MASKLIRQVEGIILDQIADLPPRHPLPRETVLAKKIGVSRGTLRKALANLELNERIRRVKGKGTFPTRGQKAIPIFQRRARMLGLLMENSFRGDYRALMTYGAFREADNQGYSIVLVRKRHREHVFQIFDDPHVDGLLVHSTDQELIQELSERSKPVCVLDHYSSQPNIDTVQADSRKEAFLMVRHLYQLGHRRIGFVVGHDREVNPERFLGYEMACRQMKLLCRPEWTIQTLGKIEHGKKAAARIMALPIAKRPTGFFVSSANTAIGMIGEFRRRGLKVPEDISIATCLGFAGTMASNSPVELTGSTCNYAAVGEAGVRALVDRIKNPRLSARNILVPVELKIRQSTGKV